MKKLPLIIGFILMVLAQWYVAGSMIFSSEKVLKEGRVFKFRTQPVDPYDPFRGKYIQLTFDATSFLATKEDTFYHGQPVYVSLRNSLDGFAEINEVSTMPPDDTEDYVRAEVVYALEDSLNTITIGYPFNRFYMEESKAYDAELAYNEAAQDTNQITYALVSVKNGEAIIMDVIVNGIPIRQAALDRRNANDQN